MNSYSKTVTNTNNVTVTADNDLIYEKYKPISIITQWSSFKKQNRKQRKKINGSHHAIITGTRKRELGEEGKLLHKSNFGELANEIMFRISRQQISWEKWTMVMKTTMIKNRMD